MHSIRTAIIELNRKFGIRPNHYAVIVKIFRQRLYLVKNDKILRQFAISTSKYGTGNIAGSNKTPLGTHRICSKIGKKAKIGVIFRDCRNTKKLSKIYKKRSSVPEDEITTRILRLEGLEPGINKGKGIDSCKRQIYIHGTPVEYLIGKPASNGCVRMRNKDIIELFNCVPRNTLVEINR